MVGCMFPKPGVAWSNLWQFAVDEGDQPLTFEGVCTAKRTDGRNSRRAAGTSRETNRRAGARTGERRRNPQQTARVATHLGRYANTFTGDIPVHPLQVFIIQTLTHQNVIALSSAAYIP